MYSVEWAKLAMLVAGGSHLSALSRAKAVCALCRRTVAVSGASLSVAGTGSHHVTSTVCGTDRLSMRLEELQRGLAEGPIADALESTFPVVEPDLTDPHTRWIWFAPAAVDAGAAAVFVMPLCAGETRLGALSLYRSTTGDLTAGQFDDFSAIADVAMEILRAGDAGPGSEPGSWAVDEGTGFQPEVHQAVGLLVAAWPAARVRPWIGCVPTRCHRAADQRSRARHRVEATAARRVRGRMSGKRER